MIQKIWNIFYNYTKSWVSEWVDIFKTVSRTTILPRYAQIPILIEDSPAIGHFEHFSYPIDFDVKITGWKPALLKQGKFMYVVGLPSRTKGIIRVNCTHPRGHIATKTIDAHTSPDWEEIFSELTEHPADDVGSPVSD